MENIEWLIIIAFIIAFTIWQLRLTGGISVAWIAIWLIFLFFTVSLPKTNFLIGMANGLFSLYTWTMAIALVLITHFKNQRQIKQTNVKLSIMFLINYLVAMPRDYQLLQYHQLAFWKMLELATRGLVAVNVMMLVLLLLWIFATMLVTRSSKQPDYLVILGAGLHNGKAGETLLGRLNKGLKLAQLYPDSKIVVTGAGRDPKVTQASVMNDYLIKNGIDESRIIAEPTAINTRQNLVKSLELINKGKKKDPQVMIVTSNFHAFRTWTYARKMDWQAEVQAASSPGSLLPLSGLRDFLGVIRDHFLIFLILMVIIVILVII